MKNRTMICMLALAMSPGAFAQDPYLGLNATFLEYSEDGVDDLDLNSVIGRVGGYFNPYVGAELRWGYGVNDDSADVAGTSASLELDDMYGAYIKGGVPVGDTFYPYAIVGYTEQEVTVRSGSLGAASDSDSDISYGLGVDVQLGEKIGLNLEYMSFYDKDDVEIQGLSIGIFTRM